MPNQNQELQSTLFFPSGWGDVARQEERTIASPEDAVTALHLVEKSKFASIKKLLPIILVILILIVVGAGVYKLALPRFEKTKNEIVLNYWGLWESENITNEVFSEWTKEHPEIKINYSQNSHREYRERLQSALVRGEGPDIFRFHITWLPMFRQELEAVPSTLMNASEFESAFYPVVSANLRSAGGYMGIPLEIDTLALFTNQEIFQSAGKVPPVLWGELRELAVELTTRDSSGRIQTAGAALGTTRNIEHWSDILGLMMLQNGVDMTNPTGVLAEDSLTFYTIFNKRDRVWDETLPNSTLAFATGRVAMYFGYSWDVFEIKKINPELDFRVSPAPQLPGTEISWASFWVEGVSKRSKYKDEAWEFLKYLSSPPAMEKLYLAESRSRLFGEPYSRIEMANKLAGDSMVIPFIRQASKAQTWYLCSRTWDNGINDRIIKYYEDAVNAVNSGKTPDDVLPTAVNGVNQLLSQYGVTKKAVY